MQPSGFLAAIFGPIIGTGAGAGMALLYAISSLGLLLVAVGGLCFPTAAQMRKGETERGF
jgi:hypothetical protein